ncbi:MAG: aconitase family protein [Hyphomonadaceae bacterium]|nr:aconitase family protein [Hyphomonadaceae bacterium]
MGRTAAEKILSRTAGLEVSAGDVVTVEPDLTWIPSGFGMIALRAMDALGIEKVKYPERLLTWLIEPSFSGDIGKSNIALETWSQNQGVEVVRGGVPNGTLAMEGYAEPGKLLVGVDSHGPTLGAVGCLGVAVGDTELGIILATGKMWINVPTTIAFRLRGKLKPGVGAKDVALHILKRHGMDIGVNRVIEFIGPGIDQFDLWARFALCNMTTEMGAFSALFPPDEDLFTKVSAGRGTNFEPALTDDENDYEQIFTINLGTIEPQVACPHSLANVKAVEDVSGIPITHAFLGSCANAWIDDLREAAELMRGRKVAESVRMLVSPVDKRTYLQAEEEGLLKVFAEAGATVTQPFCSMCAGLQGYLGPGEACISSSGRNYKARMGSPDSSIYIASAGTVAASALAGEIRDPRLVEVE